MAFIVGNDVRPTYPGILGRLAERAHFVRGLYRCRIEAIGTYGQGGCGQGRQRHTQKACGHHKLTDHMASESHFGWGARGQQHIAVFVSF